jgi:hypothetical protein
MCVMAYYGTRRGGSAGRTIRTEAEAEKILKGGYGATHVRLEKSGEVIGERWQLDGKWLWFYEPDAFKDCPSSI